MLDFKIKICGITSVHDAEMVVQAGADAIGINMYPKSSRYVDVNMALQIADAVRGQVKLVGLFVNEDFDEVFRAQQQLHFDYVQLHGGEQPDQKKLSRLPPLVRAIRWPPKDDEQQAFVSQWSDYARSHSVAAFLVDANTSDGYGGTGHVTDWRSLKPRPTCFQREPLILAGGLHATNVADAILATEPDAVDTASGVESTPGKKDRDRLFAFVREAKSALNRIKEQGDK